MPSLSIAAQDPPIQMHPCLQIAPASGLVRQKPFVWHGFHDALLRLRYWTPQAWYEQLAAGEWGLDGEGSEEEDDDELEEWSEDEDEEEDDDEEDTGPRRHSPRAAGSGAAGAGRAAERPHERRPQGQLQQPARGLGDLAPVREEAAEALLSSSPSGGPGGSGGTGSGGKGRGGVANRGLARLVRQPFTDSDSETGTTTTTTGTGTYVGPSEASGLERTGTADTQGSDSIFGLWGKPGLRGDRDQEEEEDEEEVTGSTGMNTTATTTVTNTTGTEATGVTGTTGCTGTEVGAWTVLSFPVLRPQGVCKIGGQKGGVVVGITYILFG